MSSCPGNSSKRLATSSGVIGRPQIARTTIVSYVGKYGSKRILPSRTVKKLRVTHNNQRTLSSRQSDVKTGWVAKKSELHLGIGARSGIYANFRLPTLKRIDRVAFDLDVRPFRIAVS